MTLSSATSRVSYTGNGAVDTYAYTFKIFSDDDLRVTVRDTDDVETTLTLTTDYTVTGAGSVSGGNVVLVNSAQAWLDGDGDLKSNYILTIRRVRDLVQETDIRNQGAFYPEIHEDQFDILVMQDQQQQDEINRSVKLPETISTSDFDPTLPTDIGTASAVLAINATGDGFEVGPTTTAISNAATEAANAATSADLAEDWATKIDGAVAGGEYSAKAYAIGGTGVTDTATKGAAKEWAIETASTVDGTNYSAKEHAVGTQIRGISGGGSSKDWSQYTSGTVDDTGYSAKEHAQGTQTRGLASGGSSKDWANYTGGTVDNTEYSAKKYAQDAAQSASDAATYAASSLWNDVAYKVFADSPITVVDGDSGTLFSIDCTSGNVVVNLPQISALTLTSPWAVGFKKTDSSSNTITINRGGTDTIDGATSKVISRQYAGVTLIPDTDGAPDNWTGISYGEIPIVGAIVGTSDTQTLSNKTFSDAPTLAEIATPSTPASGFGKIYFKSDGFLYQLNDDGSETKVGAGSGGVNYVSNPDFESNNSGYTRYDDGAAVNPVDATGGSPNAAFTFTRNTTTPLFDNGDGLITKDANNRQGHGVSIDAFTIDYGMQSKIAEFRFNYKTSSAYADGDIRIGFYDVTNSVLVEGSQRDLLANSINGEYIGYFQIPASCLSVRPYFHISSTNASAYTVQIDNVKFGPIAVGNVGTFVSDWQTYTPTGAWSTNTTYDARYRRVGDSIEIEAEVQLAGAPTSATFTLNLPTGLSFDTAKISDPSNGGSIFGVASGSDGGLVYTGNVTYGGASAVRIYGDDDVGAWTQAVPFTFASGDAIYMTFRAPITGWSTGVSASEISTSAAIAFRAQLSGNQTISSTALTKVAFASVTATDCYDTAAAFDTTNNRFVAPESSIYIFQFGLRLDNYTANEATTYQIQVNGTAVHIFNEVFNSASFRSPPYSTPPIRLNKGDYVELWIASTADASYQVTATQGSTFFSGFKINNPAQIAPTEFVGCSYTSDAGTSIPDVTVTTLKYEDRLYDSHNAYNTTTGEYTVPVTGKYLVTTNGTLAATATFNGSEELFQVIAVDLDQKAANLSYPSSSGTIKSAHISAVVECTKGQIITARMYQASGGALLQYAQARGNYLQITKVS